MVEAAAGAVLWREGAAGPEVAVIHRPGYDDWTFPKGKAEAGEPSPLTAVREVWEETGVHVVLGRRLPAAEYVSRSGPKRVEYWVATGRGGEFTPGDEVDRLDWLPVPAAAERLTYPRDGALLAEFARGPVSTAAYVIVRHTSAGAKLDSGNLDELRPLDARGRKAAMRLGELLACFGRAPVFSSATARCLETMLPYAALTGVEIRTDRALGTPAAAGPRLAELVADATPAIVCTHGELVPDLLARACEELSATPPDDPALAKGSFWVLQTAGGTLSSIERHDLP